MHTRLVPQPFYLGNVNGLLVEERAFAARRREHFPRHGIVNDAHDHLARLFEANGNGKARVAMREIRRAVERVHKPAEWRVRLLAAAFLGHDRVFWEVRPQARDNRLLGFLVRLRHQVHYALIADLSGTVELGQQDRPRLLGGFDGEFEIGVRAQLRFEFACLDDTIMPEIACDLLDIRCSLALRAAVRHDFPGCGRLKSSSFRGMLRAEESLFSGC